MNSVHVVEDFFGLALDSAQFSIPPKMPLDHLVELAERLVAEVRALEPQIEGDAPHVLAGTYANDNVILGGGRDLPSTSIVDLKVQMLLCDQSVVPDLLLDWGLDLIQAYEHWNILGADLLTAQSDLQAAVDLIRPIASAIRKGFVLTVPTARHQTVIRTRLGPEGPMREHYPSAVADFGDATYLALDPVTRHLLTTELGVSEFQLKGVYTNSDLLKSVEDGTYLWVDPLWVKPLMAAYGTDSQKQLAESCHFLAFCSLFGTQPMTSRAATARHFRMATSLAARDETGSTDNAQSEAAGHVARPDPALALVLPALGNLTFQQLIKLREDDDVWADMRTALTHASAVAGELHAGGMGYLRFLQSVKERVDDVVRPVSDRLQQDLKHEKWKSVVTSWYGAGLVQLAIHGIAMVLPPVALTGGFAGRAAKDAISHSRAGHIENLETASTLMLSLLPDNDD
ncbi:hypothetical protein ACFUTU_06980 [Arthrobacter sp. NPDC057388]|uniref:hypothetical protein n=1 Tax=Arthrobacter sp. NPDC057388 TaxID=3346116 RepID=UPI00362E4F97